MICLLVGFAQCFVFAQQVRNPTALDRYVKAPDSNYKFELKTTTPGKGFTSYLIEMTSQSWRKPSEVNQDFMEALDRPHSTG